MHEDCFKFVVLSCFCCDTSGWWRFRCSLKLYFTTEMQFLFYSRIAMSRWLWVPHTGAWRCSHIQLVTANLWQRNRFWMVFVCRLGQTPHSPVSGVMEFCVNPNGKLPLGQAQHTGKGQESWTPRPFQLLELYMIEIDIGFSLQLFGFIVPIN